MADYDNYWFKKKNDKVDDYIINDEPEEEACPDFSDDFDEEEASEEKEGLINSIDPKPQNKKRRNPLDKTNDDDWEKDLDDPEIISLNDLEEEDEDEDEYDEYN